MSFFEKNKCTIGATTASTAATGGALGLSYSAAPKEFLDVMSNPAIALCIGTAAALTIFLVTIIASAYEAQSNAEKRTALWNEGIAELENNIVSNETSQGLLSRESSTIDQDEFDRKLPMSQSIMPSYSFSQLT